MLSTPAAKKMKPEPTPAELQDNIVKLLMEKIDESADGLENKADALEKLTQHKAASIDALKENAEFLFKEIQDMKKDVTTVRTVTTNHERKISEVEDKVNNAECCQRRWNLRLYGLPEQEGEDVEQCVRNVCRAIAPEAGDLLHLHVDISHRIGRRTEDKVPLVITRFISRATKEMVWKSAKNSDYLMSTKPRFEEDLTTRDKETRNKLWPHIEAACKEEKKAFFRGIKAIMT
ncbi:hypothetical protein ABVT39_008153 [Epinephelus coioides]